MVVTYTLIGAVGPTLNLLLVYVYLHFNQAFTKY